MPAASKARSNVNEFETRPSFEEMPDVLHMLRGGGDERLALDPLTQRNAYGCCDRPEVGAVQFASSTASSVSQRGLGAAQVGWLQLAAAQTNASAQLPPWFDAIRARILAYCGAPAADCVLAASGTDAELIAATLAAAALRRPLTNIVLAPAETGRGVATAAEGRHFQNSAPFAAGVGAGSRLAGWEDADVRVETVEIRDAEGLAYAPAAVEDEVRRRVRAAVASGRAALVHLIDVSKTGREGLSLEAARRIAAEAPDRTLVLADCCQLRCAPERLRALLDAGFLLTLTGSKFAGGPAFSAALIAPEGWLTRVDPSRLPQGLGAHAARLDWPPAMRRAIVAIAPHEANVGLGLRWLAALGELERFAEVDPALARAVRERFRSDVARVAARSAHFALEPCEGDATRWPETIATLRLRRRGASVSKEEALQIRAALLEPLAGAGEAAARRFHVGQPVAIGDDIALRVCLSAPLINGVADRIDAGARFEAAYAPLAADLDALFEKWDVVARAAGAAESAIAPAPSPTLDPEDWAGFRAAAHRALDGMIDHVATLRERPMWTAAPESARARFRAPLPRDGRPLEAALADFDADIKPYATGNLHPGFMGWVHGAGTPVGMVAEMLAAGLNANCGGRNHIGLDVERQITLWMAEALGFPATSAGLFVTGTSMANFLAVLVARNHRLGDGVRRKGLSAADRLVAYASQAAHGCVSQALQLAGLGSDALRLVPCDADGAMQLSELDRLWAADRAAGLQPFVVVGTAGSVDIGAVDPLAPLADFCAQRGLWFHVDAAFGAMLAFSPRLRHRLAGIERADSVAFDFHKWAHVPYDAGFLMTRDADAQRRAFAAERGYLTRAPSGLAAGEVWPCDLGPDLSRGFRALKTWFTLSTLGTDRLGAAIERNCDLAARLGEHVRRSPVLALSAPVALNIVCFGCRGADRDARNRAIVEALHNEGRWAPSITMLDGVATIRCAIVNHRTTAGDIDAFFGEVEAMAGARA